MSTKALHKLSVVAIALAPAQSVASTMQLADITTVDPLGYECIAGEYLEETDEFAAVAFTLSEKIRLPRTCLPDPCDRALSRVELSMLTGTEIILARFEDEWDDYYARYADFCRKETVDPIEEIDERVATNSFWDPIINGGGTDVATLFPNTPSLIPTGGGSDPLGPIVSPGGETNDPDGGSGVSPDGDDDPDDPPTIFDPDDDPNPPDNDDSDDPDVSPVPLPSGLILLATALLGLRLRRRS